MQGEEGGMNFLEAIFRWVRDGGRSRGSGVEGIQVGAGVDGRGGVSIRWTVGARKGGMNFLEAIFRWGRDGSCYLAFNEPFWCED